MRIMLLDPTLNEVRNTVFSPTRAGLSTIFVFKDAKGCNKTSPTHIFDKPPLTAPKFTIICRIF